MLGVDERAVRVIWSAALCAGVVWLLYSIRTVIFIVILAVLFAYVIWPLVAIAERFFRLHTSTETAARIWALAVVYPVLTGLAGFIGTIVAPQIVAQGTALFTRASNFVTGITQGGMLERVSESRGWSLVTLYAIRDALLRHSGVLVPYVQSLGAELFHLITSLWVVVIVPIIAFFLLKDAETFVSVAAGWLNEREERAFLRRVLVDLHDLLAQYMRALILLSMLTFAAYAIFLFVIGAPNAWLLAAVGGVFEFIPIVGPAGSGIFILLASWVAGYPHLLWILVFLVVWRLVQDYVNSPWLLGSRVEMHPLLVIIGVLAGAELAGIPGTFLSVPVMAALRIVFRLKVAREKAREAAP
jgi:predicted PurR-regulated permease PerM